jgi:hypothetical protein
MARNRKYRTVAARFGPAIKAFVLCLLIGGSGIGYVWQKNQILELGKQISAREARLRILEQQNDKMRKQMAEMTTVAFLEGKIRELNLGLAAPAQSQVWHLKEPPRELVRPQGDPSGPPQPQQAPGQGRDRGESQYALHETRGSR